MTDQDSTSCYVFNRLRPDCQMLNISAGSWGPDNCAAYLKHYGTFKAKAILLLVSSLDAYDNMTFEKVVGIHPSYPNRKYHIAWYELFDRYIYPRLYKLKKKKDRGLDPDERVLAGIDKRLKPNQQFNCGFDQLKKISVNLGIPMYVCLHPEINELKRGAYNEQGKKIINWCIENDISIIKELDEGISADMYRDGIHTNEKGQRFQGELMAKYIKIK